MSINKAIIVGNLGRDPEIRALPSGQSVANFSVAATARFKDRNGEEQEHTEWFRVVTSAGSRTTASACLARTQGLCRRPFDHSSVPGERRQQYPLSN